MQCRPFRLLFSKQLIISLGIRVFKRSQTTAANKATLTNFNTCIEIQLKQSMAQHIRTNAKWSDKWSWILSRCRCCKFSVNLSSTIKTFFIPAIISWYNLLTVTSPNQWSLQWLCHLGHFKNCLFEQTSTEADDLTSQAIADCYLLTIMQSMWLSSKYRDVTLIVVFFTLFR